jgi:transmembrane sensor
MFSRNKTDWTLLTKYMTGEAEEREKQAIEEWMNHSAENRALYKELTSYWRIMDTMEKRFDVDGAWEKLHSRIAPDASMDSATDRVMQSGQARKFWLTPLKVAASILIVVSLASAWFLYKGNIQKEQVIASLNEKNKVVKLPDGTVVYLNTQSSISYDKLFNRQFRDVKLSGEAFFEVSHNKSKPFRIFAGDACVKVLGTSFNVNARGKKNEVEVYVSTGIVELSEATDHNNRVLLHPGNIGVFNHKEVVARKAQDLNSIAWKTGSLSFHDTRLTDAINLLNDVFNVNIVVRDPAVDTTFINGEYQNDKLDEILKVICIQNRLTLAKSDDTIYLSR